MTGIDWGGWWVPVCCALVVVLALTFGLDNAIQRVKALESKTEALQAQISAISGNLQRLRNELRR